MSKAKVASGIMAAVLVVGVQFTAKWEGKSNTAYWDRYGKVWTYGYGETAGATKGSYCTDEECLSMLQKRWKGFYDEMVEAFPKLSGAPISVQATATDLAYNNGTAKIKAAANTSLYLREGRWRDFCNILPAWSKSNGKFVKGLHNRRVDSRSLCLSGL
jgi:lysozyme